ncbi:MAG: TIGR01777 family oxidoreductase [Phycisphaerales bacterium]
MSKNKLIIAGGSGFLGLSFAKYLASKSPDTWQVTILSRSKPKCDPNHAQWVQWDGRTLGEWTKCLEDATHILNLAGRSVDCRKTPDRCDEILRSRVESTAVLGQALKELNHTPQVWVQISTASIYGDPPAVICDESSFYGYGLAPTVAKAWEATYHEHCPEHIRKVILRTSFVIGKTGGAFPTLRRVAALGLGGRVGSGTQGLSWIHIDDMNRIFEDTLTNDTRTGPYIATAPHPVSYVEFMRALRKAIKQPIALPGPTWGLKLMTATLLDTDPELILYGRYCIPKRLMDEGFEFKYAHIAEAFADLTQRS